MVLRYLTKIRDAVFKKHLWIHNNRLFTENELLLLLMVSVSRTQKRKKENFS